MTQRTKRTWTKWQRLIQERARRGQSVAEFCRERELHIPYFFAWRKRLRENTPVPFLEVQMPERTTQSRRAEGISERLHAGLAD